MVNALPVIGRSGFADWVREASGLNSCISSEGRVASELVGSLEAACGTMV
jgi:hypothetical protein